MGSFSPYVNQILGARVGVGHFEYFGSVKVGFVKVMSKIHFAGQSTKQSFLRVLFVVVVSLRTQNQYFALQRQLFGNFCPFYALSSRFCPFYRGVAGVAKNYSPPVPQPCLSLPPRRFLVTGNKNLLHLLPTQCSCPLEPRKGSDTPKTQKLLHARGKLEKTGFFACFITFWPFLPVLFFIFDSECRANLEITPSTPLLVIQPTPALASIKMENFFVPPWVKPASSLGHYRGRGAKGSEKGLTPATPLFSGQKIPFSFWPFLPVFSSV